MKQGWKSGVLAGSLIVGGGLHIAGCGNQTVDCGVNGTYDPVRMVCAYPPPDTGADAGNGEGGEAGDVTVGNDGGMDVAIDVVVDTGLTDTGPVDTGIAINRALAFPRQIAPLSTSTATSQTPTFHWSLVNGIDGAAVDVCKDRGFSQQCQTVRATGTSGQPVTPLSAGVWFWRARGRMGATEGAQASATWEVFIGLRSATNDTSWGTIADFNGDGIADALIGAPGEATPVGGTGPGAIYVYAGGTQFSGASPTVILRNPTAAAGWGSALASAGDVNGDGFLDLISAVNGTAYLFYGGSTGLGMTPSAMVGGSMSASVTTVSSAGDFNGDGYADVILGEPSAANYQGQADIHYGSATGIITINPFTLASGTAGDAFGAAACAPDLNGDGVADVVLGAPGSGSTYVYFGTRSVPQRIPSLTLQVTGGLGSFGAVLADAGDVNGDGYGDLIAGGPTSVFSGVTNGTTYAYVFLGGVPVQTASPHSISNPGGSCGLSCGVWASSVSGVGDINGDGYDDVAVSIAVGMAGAVGAYVFEGGASGLQATGTRVEVSSTSCARNDCQPVVVNTGDVNNDGNIDLLLGGSAVNGGVGAAYMFLGSGAGVPMTPSITLTGSGTAQELFGTAIR